MDSTGIKVQPYSPDWFHLRKGCFTASEGWKIMSEPRGKTYAQLYADAIESLSAKKSKYESTKNKETKTAKKIADAIESLSAYAKSLEEKKDDLQLSDTANRYILEKVWEILSDTVKQGVDNFATQWGVENEPLAKKWYVKKTGLAVSDPYLCFHNEIEGLSCTPDLFASEDGLTEFKCPWNGAIHLEHCLITTDEYFKSEHPDKYWQCKFQMFISKKEWCDFVSFDPRINSPLGYFSYRLYPDGAEEELMEKKVKSARLIFNEYVKMFKGELINA